MSDTFTNYRNANHVLPQDNWTWNLYGAGLENMGRGHAPESFSVPRPNDDQMLVRVDSIGICFSDVKILGQGGNHPKLYGRDLAVDPTRLGHEVSLTVMDVGRNLQDRFHPGDRFAVQPDIYQQGKSGAYGYTIPGGMTQYHLIGAEMLETDTGVCLLPLPDEMGYAESALLEPWGCVMAAYTQRRRLHPKQGGRMWIVGRPGDEGAYEFSAGLDAPAEFILTDVPQSVRKLVDAACAKTGAKAITRDGLRPEAYAELSKEATGGAGFDDIVALNLASAQAVEAIAKVVARRGTCNLVGAAPLDGAVKVDFGRLHYDYIAFIGNRGPDIAASYGEARNRCELRAGGTAVFVGAGGPMGQMHVQRAIELVNGPAQVIVTDVSEERLQALRDLFMPLAAKLNRKLIFFNPMGAAKTLRQVVMEATNGQGADDVVVSVPAAKLMEEGDSVMKPDGMLVLFAGVPNGTLGSVNLSNVYLSNAQYTGTSGLTIDDQREVMNRRMGKTLSPGRSVAAIGGIETAGEAIQAVIDGKFAGKVVVFAQLHDLPLTGLKDLEKGLPEVGGKLGPDLMWTNEAEMALIEKLWQKPS